MQGSISHIGMCLVNSVIYKIYHINVNQIQLTMSRDHIIIIKRIQNPNQRKLL